MTARSRAVLARRYESHSRQLRFLRFEPRAPALYARLQGSHRADSRTLAIWKAGRGRYTIVENVLEYVAESDGVYAPREARYVPRRRRTLSSSEAVKV